MAGQARSGFAMDVIGQSSRSSSAATSRPHSHLARRHDAFRDDDDDEDDHFQRLHGNGSSRHAQSNVKSRSNGDELLSGFSKSKGAEKIRKSPPRQGPKVIAKQADLNWMDERKRRLGLERYREQLGSLTSMRNPQSNSQTSAEQEREAAAERIGDEKQLSGLQVRKKEKSREEEEMEEIRRLQEQAKEGRSADVEDRTPPLSQAGESPGVDHEDEAARRALLSGQGLGASFRIDEERVIPISEEEALKRDTDTRPEPPSLSDYAKMPVEEFGAALLRGMGWKEGMGAGKNKQGPTTAPEVKKRAALLGLGAKERNTDHSNRQFGVRGKNFKVERPERRYIPVTKIEREKKEDDRPRRIEDDRRRERSRSPSRRRSDRGDSYDRRDDRRHREYDEEYERERDRRKRKERERERERPYHSGHTDDRR